MVKRDKPPSFTHFIWIAHYTAIWFPTLDSKTPPCCYWWLIGISRLPMIVPTIAHTKTHTCHPRTHIILFEKAIRVTKIQSLNQKFKTPQNEFDQVLVIVASHQCNCDLSHRVESLWKDQNPRTWWVFSYLSRFQSFDTHVISSLQRLGCLGRTSPQTGWMGWPWSKMATSSGDF